MTTSDADPTTPDGDRPVDPTDPRPPPWDAPPEGGGAADEAEGDDDGGQEALPDLPEHGDPGLPPAGDDPMGGPAPSG